MVRQIVEIDPMKKTMNAVNEPPRPCPLARPANLDVEMVDAFPAHGFAMGQQIVPVEVKTKPIRAA